MSVRRSLTICRVLVALLIFNIVAPMAMADTGNSNTILICTTAGLVEVNIDDLSEEQSNHQLQAGQHCSFCTLIDTDNVINADHLAYPAPNDQLALNYQSVSPKSPTKAITKHALMRAPPVYL